MLGNWGFYSLYLKIMTKNLDKDGLGSIAHNYDLFYIDLWGVVHNGIKLYEGAINTLNELKKNNKDFVLLTNAPRPNETVKNFLEKMGMEEQFRNHVFTSGEAALNYLKKSYSSKLWESWIQKIEIDSSFCNGSKSEKLLIEGNLIIPIFISGLVGKDFFF